MCEAWVLLEVLTMLIVGGKSTPMPLFLRLRVCNTHSGWNLPIGSAKSNAANHLALLLLEKSVTSPSSAGMLSASPKQTLAAKNALHCDNVYLAKSARLERHEHHACATTPQFHSGVFALCRHSTNHGMTVAG